MSTGDKSLEARTDQYRVGSFRCKGFRRLLLEAQSLNPALTWVEHDTGFLEKTFVVTGPATLIDAIYGVLTDTPAPCGRGRGDG